MNAILELLGEVTELLEQTPGGAELFQRLRDGEITADEAVEALVKIAHEAGLAPQLEETSEKVTALAPAGPLTPESLTAAGRPLLMKTSTGIPQLNPLYEAAIAERVSLDGDAPELRFGALPEGGSPAVPVRTTARDPVIIGLMLERASNEVHQEIKAALVSHMDLCGRLLEDAKENAEAEGRDVGTALTLTKERLPPVPVGVAGYEAGEVPALRDVTPPDPHVTAVMEGELRRIATFKVLATTQGRMSAAPVIEKGVCEALAAKGFEVSVRKPFGEVSEFGWIAQVFAPDDLSDNFNPIQVAIDQIAHHFREGVGASPPPPGGWAMSITPYNQGVADRRFGWVAHVGSALEQS